jgi:TRAP-type C4-dicarboxylate transport system permease small subunit
MGKLLCALLIAAGIWLAYLGYERQQSVAGRADSAIARIGQSLNGAPSSTLHVRYYAGAAVLIGGGLLGLVLVRR